MQIKKKIIIVFGTRPEAIKLAPVIHELKKNQKDFLCKVCITAQHREMLDQILKIFEIKPDIDLNLMKKKQSLSDITALIIKSMQKVFEKFKPDLVIVHGDTTTSFATSLVCFYNNIKLAHVEAGLRTNNLNKPFPEEFNRQIISKLSSIHFAPTYQNKKNLLLEGVSPKNIYVTGNSVIDALFWIHRKIDSNKSYNQKLKQKLDQILKFDWINDSYILITGHRRENFGKGFSDICKALKELSLKYPKIHFIYPVHLNPNVKNYVLKILKNKKNIHLIPPQEYEMFILLLKYSLLIMTDSGGIQEEAPSFGKFVLVMRDVTERPEAIKTGLVKLVGTNKTNIIKNVSFLIDNCIFNSKKKNTSNPYGNGNSSIKIVKIIKNLFK
tara:strand:+ start:4069 stop:5220 length:1152 start_codon:yes stop_codon:yes gene_type:complete